MPPPIATAIKDLAFDKFRSYQIKIPVDWKEPSGDPDGPQYADAFKPEERSVPPASPTLFVASSSNKYHVDTQKQLNANFGDYMTAMSTAIATGWGMWMPTVAFGPLVVAASTGSGGVMAGAPLGKLIMGAAVGLPMMGSAAAYTNAICSAIDIGWTAFLLTVKAAGTNIWPMFNAFPSPAAVAIPGIPIGFGDLVQVDASIQPAVLQSTMIGLLGNPMAAHHKELFGAMAHAFYETYKDWKTKAKLTMILGNGAVPSMTTPVPVPGPVATGVGMMAPGGLI